MYKSINVDAVVEHIKNIVDCNRCAVCDREDGTRMRYACGHSSCENCVVVAVDCSVCLTPPQSASKYPVEDRPYTQRAVAAVNLLSVFQNEFHIDVYKRHRISEQLKVEKELFPECIQAPVKYFNKRKSFKNSNLDKENRLSQLPGEEVSPIVIHKMENKSENVELWLNRYVRKPFAELNANDKTLGVNRSQTKRKVHNDSNNENIPSKVSSRKRSHSKTVLPVKNTSFKIVEHTTPLKKMKRPEQEPKNEQICVKPDTSTYFSTDINVNNKSGVVMDDEAAIVIEDSQSIKIDKDWNAWMAVQEAEKNNQYESTSQLRSLELTPMKVRSETVTKVPFYLKGKLSNKYIDHNQSNYQPSNQSAPNNKSTTNTEPTEDVSITVENKNFITVIKIQQIDQSTKKTSSTQSVEVQTEVPERFVSKNADDFQESEDLLFRLGKLEKVNKEINKMNVNKSENVIIEESDSDDELEASMSLEVTAEIHRSCEEGDYAILADVDDLEEHSKRPRRGPRGYTPTSSNSSEKENYNPNRMKKAPTSKKKPMKK